MSEKQIKVLQVGTFLYKDKAYPWRVLETGQLQIFDEEREPMWSDVLDLNDD